MRERIYTIIEKAKPGDKVSKFYDIFLMAVAFASLIPLMFKETAGIMGKLDLITVYLLFADYILRFIVHDFTTGRHQVWSFVKYPFSFLAIMDLLSILPSLGLLPKSFMILRILRIFKVLHYSKSFVYISNVFRKQKKILGSVLLIALTYIYVSALAMFSYEPETFENFFDALYWATTALTTVGYGDVYPHSDVGQLISMVSSLFGIAVIALPAGIVTGGFVEEISKDAVSEEEDKKDEQ